MSIEEYNIRFALKCIAFSIICICMIFVLVNEVKRTGWTKNIKLYKIIITVICTFFSIHLIVYMFAGIATETEILSNVTVDEIGDPGRIYAHFKIYVYDEDGERIMLYAFVASRELKNKLRNIRVGDTITVWYEPRFGHICNVEFCE